MCEFDSHPLDISESQPDKIALARSYVNYLYPFVILLSLFQPRVTLVEPTQAKAVPLPRDNPVVLTVAPRNPIVIPSSVRSYVEKQSIIFGVNPIDTLFIVSHESQDCQNMSGDDGISIGCWMFNLKANPQISKACAMDLPCSTKLALSWIVAGKINKWSTWRFRCEWYADAPDC